MKKALIKVENLNFQFEKDQFIGNEINEVLKDISFSIYENEAVGIVGESGSGKTTLAKILIGFLTDYKGQLNVNISNLREIQILFQNNDELINPLRKIDSILNEAISLVTRNDKKDPKSELLELVGIPEKLLDKKGYQLSGGERQRVALARILAVEPKILILDEPFAAQDQSSQKNLAEVFLQLKEKGTTIICVSHNIRILKEFIDRILVLNEGKIIEDSTTDQFFSSPKTEFSRFLLESEKMENINY